jgi:hypothetical protein
MVDLRKNNLSGEFPLFLRNAALLTFLDLSHNTLSGSVPTWIAEKMPKLEVIQMTIEAHVSPVIQGGHYL